MEDNSVDNPLEGLDLSVLFGEKGAGSDDTQTILNPTIPQEDDIKSSDEDEEEENEDGDENEDSDKDEDSDEVEIEEEEEATITADDKDSSNPINVFASMLAESGLIEYNESEEYDETKLVEAFENKVVQEVESYKDSLPEVIKDLINNYEEGVPLADLIGKQSKIQEYENLDVDQIEENENLQKQLIRDLLSKTGFDKDEIEERLSDYEDAGILEKEAKRSLNKLISLETKEKESFVESQKQEAKLREQRYTEYINNIKSTIDKSEEFIPGLKVNKDDKKKLIEGIFKTDKDGKNAIVKARETDPNFDLKVAYAALVLNWDFSKIEQKATTKATKKLAEAIKAQDKKQSQGVSKKTNSSVDLGIMEKIAKNKI